MQKISFIALPGGGKTYWANKLGYKLGLPVLDIDPLLESKKDNDDYRRKYDNLLDDNTEGWVIDGYCGLQTDRTWEESDSIIFLNIIKPRLYVNTFKRLASKRLKGIRDNQSTYEGYRKIVRIIKEYEQSNLDHVKRLRTNKDISSKILEFRSQREVSKWVNSL